MKKNLLFAVLSLLIWMPLTAQLSFSSDTVMIQMAPDSAHKGIITVSNNSGHDILIRWTLISSTLNDNTDGDSDNSNNWALQFCECNTCYTNDFDSLPGGAQCTNPMANGDAQDWYLTVDPNGQQMYDAEWIIEVQNVTDGITDTLYYLVMMPNSTKQISYDADIKTFPNPVQDELIVHYKFEKAGTPVIKVYNILGSLVMQIPVSGVNGRLAIDMSGVQNGVYFFTVEDKGQRLYIKKFTVAR